MAVNKNFRRHVRIVLHGKQKVFPSPWKIVKTGRCFPLLGVAATHRLTRLLQVEDRVPAVGKFGDPPLGAERNWLQQASRLSCRPARRLEGDDV